MQRRVPANDLIPRMTCTTCKQRVYTDDVVLSHRLPTGDDDVPGPPCPGAGHPPAEAPPPGFTGHCQRIPKGRWTHLSGTGAVGSGVEIYLMYDGRICARPEKSEP